MAKKVVVYGLLFCLVVAFGHFGVTQPLFWSKLPYRIEAAFLAMTSVECDENAPTGLKRILQLHSLPNFSLEGRVIAVDARGKSYQCAVSSKEQRFQRFRFASMTKLVTAEAILELQKEKKIDVDAPLLSFFPEVPADQLYDPRIQDVTIYQLLNHSGGFGGIFGSDDMVKKGHRSWCPYDMDHLKKVRLAGTPGSNYAYSNISYCLLGEVIARVTGETYREYIQRRYLAGSSLSFVDEGYMDGEPEYDFSNDRRLHKEYATWVDFNALSSAAGLIGDPADFASLLWRNVHLDTGEILGGNTVEGCGKEPIPRCYSWNLELVFDEQGHVEAGVQQGYVPGASSMVVVTPDGKLLMWVAPGAAILNEHKKQIQDAAVDFLRGWEDK